MRIQSDSSGCERFAGEANDCTVRALANAAGMPYSIANRILSKAGRPKGKRCDLLSMHSAYKRMGFSLESLHGNDRTARFMKRAIAYDAPVAQGITLGKKLSELKQGRFVVMVLGHVFAVVDGKVLDYGNNKAGSRVQAVYKLEQQAVLFDK